MKKGLKLFLVLGLLAGTMSAYALNLMGEDQKKFECKYILAAKDKEAKQSKLPEAPKTTTSTSSIVTDE